MVFSDLFWGFPNLLKKGYKQNVYLLNCDNFLFF